MRSRSLVLFFSLMLLLGLCVALAACRGTEDPPPDTAAPTETTAPTEPDTPDVTPPETVPETEPETETELETYELYEEIFGDIRVQLYSASALRIEAAVDGAFCDDKTIAVQNRTDWRGVPVERTEVDGAVHLITAAYTVVIPADATIDSIRVNDPAGKLLWAARGTSGAVTSLPDPGDTPRAWAFNDTPRVTVPENGFTEVNATAANNGFTSTAASDYYILVCEKDPFLLRDDYNRLVGSCDMVTVKALGLWFSRYYAYSDTQLMQLVREFRRRGYPIDYVVVDTDWKVGGSTGYDINTSLFPNMEAFLSKMHDLNVSIAFNDHVRDSKDSVLSSTQLTWFNENLTAKLEMGLDTWWYDRNWHYTLVSPFSGIHQDMLGQMLYLSIMEAYNEPLGRRTVMLSNYYTDYHSRLTLPAYIGTHRYSIQWTGDITPAVLPTELENMVQLGVSTSTAYVSSDIGGHLNSPTDGMFIRWTQYGALSPIMRYHSSGADRSPWTHGKQANAVANTYINMRYRLMPLFYTLAYENYAHALPIARRLDFYYPQYEESKANDQYLLGEDILIAPITEGEQPPDPSWLKTPDGKAGVRISFYNNKDLSGNPIHTLTASTIDFNWGTASPAAGVSADNFSAVLRTTLTVGDADIYLGVINDDGVRVYVDDQLIIDHWEASDSTMLINKDVVLKAHTSHDIRIEYYEEAGGAVLRLLCVTADSTSSRTVFIPDGEWMDVFTGQVYTGPQTITATHSLETSPIFVRKGSILALAHESDYADTDQWERLVLDVYPAEGKTDSSLLYEDDGESLDYQSGAYRKTEMSVSTEGGKTTIEIGRAKGAYTTSWTEREWTVRVHTEDVTSVTVNGRSVAFEVISKDASAAPFAAEGGSPDGDVVVITFRAPLSATTHIVID